jgi:hypothetical protein
MIERILERKSLTKRKKTKKKHRVVKSDKRESTTAG